MEIRFTKHALAKFSVLRRHGVRISRFEVIAAVRTPEVIDYRRLPLLIAQKSFDAQRVLRVVHKIERKTIIIITFYPGRKSQYEKN